MLKTSTVQSVLENHSHLWRAVRSLQCVRAMYLQPRTQAPKAFFLTGPTGCGKTQYALTVSRFLPSVYWKNDTKWWDGYEQQTLIVWDEFRGCPPGFFLSFLNYVPLQVETKGGSIHLNSPIVVFTTNLSLQDCFPGVDQATFAAIRRRVMIMDFNNDQININ